MVWTDLSILNPLLKIHRDREINMIYHAIPNHQSITNKSCCGYFIWKHRESRVANSGWFLETENLPQAGPSGQGRVALSLSSTVTGTRWDNRKELNARPPNLYRRLWSRPKTADKDRVYSIQMLLKASSSARFLLNSTLQPPALPPLSALSFIISSSPTPYNCM